MSKAIENAVRQATNDIVTELGYELADVRFAQETDVEGWVLTLFIYHPDGITIDDCEKVSHAVDPIIEQIDPTEEPYFLSVSSLGLDRPFHVTRDYERYLNQMVEIKLYVPVSIHAANDPSVHHKSKAKHKNADGKKKEFSGILRAVDDDTVTIQIGEGSQVFARSQIAKASPGITW